MEMITSCIKANMETCSVATAPASANKKQPTKSVVRLCKLLARMGRWIRKSEANKPSISVTCCMDEPVEPLSSPSPLPASPVNVTPTLVIPTGGLSTFYSLPLPSPSSPRAIASYPPTPDYVKYPSEPSCSTSTEAFFPRDALFERLNNEINHEDGETKDWAIDYTDLEIGARLQGNSTGDIYRGRWHGNVLIYKHNPENSVEDFLADVENMSKIRHENILLFLGATVDNEEELTIVMQPPKHQQSLHQLLCSPRRLNKLPHNLKWSTAHQLAQVVSYLHAKDIQVGTALHTGNIFLESEKIKLSLLDFGVGPADMFSRGNSSRNHLTSFLAPELLCTAHDVSALDMQQLKAMCNEATDSFAFGGILYELFTEQKPFRGLSSQELQSLLQAEDFAKIIDRSDIPPSIQKIILHCWKYSPEDRPTFAHILTSLKRKTFLLSHHSTSQPDLLDVIGTSRSKSFSSFQM